MTVSSTIDREDFPGNGVATVFSLPFRFFFDSEIEASLIDDATGLVTPLTLGVNYSLYGADQPEVDGSAVSQLTMVVAPPVGKTLFVQRVLPFTQKTSIVNQGRFFAIIHENVFDRLTMLMQQLMGDSSRYLRVPASDVAPDALPNAATRANKVLAFDADGNPVQSNLSLDDIESGSTDAAAYAELSRKWAENPEDVPVITGEFSSLHWAAKSEDFSIAAAASAASAARINSSVATGTVNALVGAYTPAIAALSAGLFLSLRPTGANTSATPTFTPNTGVIAAKTIVKGANQPLVSGDIAGAGHWLELQYDATLDKWVLLNPANSAAQPNQIQPIAASVAANALTFTLNPTQLDFRSATLTNGVPNKRAVNTAITLVVPSGATLGTVSGIASKLVLLAMDNGGTIELAVANLAGGINFDETTLISTTAISAAATSASVIYSTTARSSLPFRVVGLFDSTQATAGAWAATGNTQGVGGQALTSLGSVGFGQTPQLVTGSRALGTTYYNTSNRPRMVYISATPNTTTTVFNFTINGVVVFGTTQTNNSFQASDRFAAMIPPGGSYSFSAVSGGATTFAWAETF